ncbi:proline-rich receptor-like protein kinase perk5 [Phtheirospermum japonicum]|uniref:non-specific serine/threonine protein kinase n=1 Tax=Phtheirospermum japonicum TaxID=374723 RepID=A0A830BI98_9LAMI|nr:proline-rich receptor-like protein kinase perk5 [Phtheirospermum japonicum]
MSLLPPNRDDNGTVEIASASPQEIGMSAKCASMQADIYSTFAPDVKTSSMRMHRLTKSRQTIMRFLGFFPTLVGDFSANEVVYGKMDGNQLKKMERRAVGLYAVLSKMAIQAHPSLFLSLLPWRTPQSLGGVYCCEEDQFSAEEKIGRIYISGPTTSNASRRPTFQFPARRRLPRSPPRLLCYRLRRRLPLLRLHREPENPSSPPPPAQSPPPTGSPPAPAAARTPPPAAPSPGSGPTPVFSPPPPGGSSGRSPPSPAALTRPPPRSGSNSDGDSPPSSSPGSNTDIAIIAGIIGGGAVILALMFVCLICLRRKSKKREYYLEQGPPPKGGDQYYKGPTYKKSPSIDPNIKIPPPGVFGTPAHGRPASNEFSPSYSGQNPIYMQPLSPNVGGYGAKSPFTYDELAAATHGFSQANLLGQGGFGYVHKGVLPNGKEVAVKSLKSGSGQGEREFQAEVEIISRVHHRYLVSLVGYCIAGEQRMLVYEFVQNKTLEFHLHAKGQPVMDWASRLRIAIGSAKGLAYLHEDCHPRIIHRDIKAANILLDSNYEAKVADFGLAKLSSDNYTHVSTRVMGTFGYLAPEYAASGKLTEKSDVFSFGVMLLELITGRRPVDPTNKQMDSLSLVDWARPLASKALESGDYSGLVDRRLEDNFVPHEMARMVACAAACIRHSARRRPRMSQIVRALDGDSSLEDLNEGVKPGQSQPFNPNENVGTYDTGAYNADMMKFRKMVMTSQEFNSNEYGATSEYGLNASSSSSTGSTDMDSASPRKQKR